MRNSIKYALVTQASEGVGRQLIEIIAAEGYNLVIIGNKGAEIEVLSKDITERFSVSVLTMEADLSNAEDAFIIHHHLEELNVRIDIIANGLISGQMSNHFVQGELYSHINIIEFNIMSFVVLAKLFLPRMIERGYGKIISLVADEDTHSQSSAVHIASLAFVDSLMSTLATELKGSGVTVVSLRSASSRNKIFSKSETKNGRNDDYIDRKSKSYSDRDGYESFMRDDDVAVR